MQEIFLEIPGRPITKETHRSHCVVNWKTKTVKRWTRNPKREKANDVSLQMRAQYNGPLLEEGLFIIFEFYMPIPIRWCKALKEKARNGTLHHLNKPDASNLAKFYEDCMTGVIFQDDKQIVWCTPVKIYDDNPRAEILIKKFDYEKYCSFKKTFGS